MSTTASSPICVFALNNSFEVPNLEKILCHDDVKRLGVVVVSVAGRYRTGKSFLLNFMIKFLRAGGKLDSSSDSELSGFEWKHALDSVTRGVLIWPEVFKVRLASGENVAVILVDTQGVFDPETELQESASIFSFSVLLSSVQVFNLKERLNVDDLSHLELFAKYGEFLVRENKENVTDGSKPFQDIVFLFRDWCNAESYPYGWEGGLEYLNKKLNIGGGDGELQSMRDNIRNSFESYRCFLMPCPGDKVRKSPTFRGYCKDIESQFLLEMEEFLRGLLTSENLVLKKINGKVITLQEWCSSVAVYSRHLREGKKPEVKTLYEATMEATNTALLNECIDFYTQEVSKLLQGDEEDVFQEKHKDVRRRTIAKFRSSRDKMGDEELWEVYEDKLSEKVEKIYDDSFKMMNKNLLIAKRRQEELRSREIECKNLRERAELEAAGAAETEKKLAEAKTRAEEWESQCREQAKANAEEQEKNMAELRAYERAAQTLREQAREASADAAETKKKLAEVEARVEQRELRLREQAEAAEKEKLRAESRAHTQEMRLLRKLAEAQAAKYEDMESKVRKLEADSEAAKQAIDEAKAENERLAEAVKEKENSTSDDSGESPDEELPKWPPWIIWNVKKFT